ncbi:hypothetical protein CUT44_30240 [Streptomyces carminius]|uniref:Uncharacterized protein n=1 Tax=Streptomyces carminius TaxID=2665496 RepID=A0A2M8LRC7_9ACTN|nr:hypothetical protein [Streptomyces carminius]PJE94495.1 hypothetical protein CUT44_30240 [Streptomyces carminius]
MGTHHDPPGAAGEEPPVPSRRARCRRAARGWARWAARRRNVAADQFLRGACYGAGATAVSLLTVWAQTR